MLYHFKIHEIKKSNSFWAECIELKGCVTQAETLDELKKNMAEALNLYLDEPDHSNVIFPMPKKNIRKKNVLQIPVEPKIAFSLLLRQQRLKKKFTQKEVANQLGLKSIYSYQRLESSKSANPSLSTLAKLKKVFPRLSLDSVTGDR